MGIHCSNETLEERRMNTYLSTGGSLLCSGPRVLSESKQ